MGDEGLEVSKKGPPTLQEWVARAVTPRRDGPGFLWARWLFLRGLGVIFGSAFLSLAFQIHGLVGPRGILPAGEYLELVRGYLGFWKGLWFAPSLLWLSSSDAACTALVVAGLAASVALVLGLWPRGSLAVAGLAFLSFVAAARDFSGYQSDGMLLEASLLAWFLAPPGWRPGLGADAPPPPAALWFLRWEWFRIYFESGIVKLASGETQWRDLTAMVEYYQNNPLPTWIGWYVHHWPRGFHVATAAATLGIELGLVWLALVGRRARLAVFFVVTTLQIGIILTANYAFLNYLVLLLGVLLLDDRMFEGIGLKTPRIATISSAPRWRRMAIAVVFLWLGVATVEAFVAPGLPGPLGWPSRSLAPFRVANAYGLFAVMTRGRYEIEFQGTRDGEHWEPYPFRFKPQALDEAPGIYAPYQPRFEWNLWFASLAPWQRNPWVLTTERRLLAADAAVLRLFASDPFDGERPLAVRTIRWQYTFTDPETRRETGRWWRRASLGEFAPRVERPERDGLDSERDPEVSESRAPDSSRSMIEEVN